jgi:hypothetical protein
MGYTDLNKPKKIEGANTVQITGPASTFGSIDVMTLQPQAQGDFVHGINNQIWITSSFLAGAQVVHAGSLAEISSGTDINGSATILLRRGLKYRPGQGSSLRATALFDTPDAGNAQFLGAGTAECGYFIGYFGTSFGILHSSTGQREVRRLDIDTPANTEDVTVTLDGDSVIIPVVGGASEEQTAYQLSLGDYSQLGKGGYLVDVVSSSVFFICARSNSTSTGAFSAVGAVAGDLGTVTRLKEGLDQTNTFIPTGSFNVDKLDGTGPTGMTLDPQKGNIYQIAFQYLGFGSADFAVEDPNTGHLRTVHRIKNANSRTSTVLKNPNVSGLVTSANIGGTTSKTIKCGSVGTFVEGDVIKLDPKFAQSFSFTSLNKTTYHPLALLKANRIFNGESCFGEFDLLRAAASNTVASKTLSVALFLGAEVTGEVNFQYVDEENSVVSVAELDPTGGSPPNTISNLSSLSPFYELLIGPNNSVAEQIEKLNLVFSTSQTVCLAVKTDATGMAGSVSLGWFEQQ